MAVLAAAVIFALIMGLIGGALLMLLLAPAAPSQPVAPVAPKWPTANPGLHPAMQQALKDAPTLFATARNMEAIRAALACKVCGEGSHLLCSTCGLRLCPAHLEPGKHACTGSKPPGESTP